MAIIKCPECGHQISDKAPICPSCGVEIAGKITTCPDCGKVYFKDEKQCPSCHAHNANFASGANTDEPITSPFQKTRVTPPVSPEPQRPDTQQQSKKVTLPPLPKRKSNHSVIVFSFIFAAIVCGIMYYFYDNANQNKEQEAYEYAMQSTDPMVLQSYLNTYKTADPIHIDSIQSHLSLLKQGDTDWTNALVSGSKEALEAYLQKYPNSPHKREVYNKIDSIDWAVAKSQDTADGYQAYLNAHADGSHIEEAENAMKKVNGRGLQPEEKQMVSNIFRKFFLSINAHNSSRLTDTCEDVLSSLLGKSSATKADVVTFMEKLYKDDVVNMVWRINKDYQIKKREVGDNEYEYQVQFSARQDLDLNDGSKQQHLFKINGVVSPAGKVSSFNMSKVNVGE